MHPCGNCPTYRLLSLSPCLCQGASQLNLRRRVVPVLKAGQDVDRRRRTEEALHGGPRHADIRREGTEGLVAVVEEVLDADETLEAEPSARHSGVEHRLAGQLGLGVRFVPAQILRADMAPGQRQGQPGPGAIGHPHIDAVLRAERSTNAAPGSERDRRGPGACMPTETSRSGGSPAKDAPKQCLNRPATLLASPRDCPQPHRLVEPPEAAHASVLEVEPLPCGKLSDDIGHEDFAADGLAHDPVRRG